MHVIKGVAFLLCQGIAEIVLIIALESLGVEVLPNFSKNNLIIENVQGVVWEISIKTLIFSFAYMPLFVTTSLLLKKRKSNLAYGTINLLLSLGLSITFLLFIRKVSFIDVLNLLIVTVVASAMIIIANKVIAWR